MKKPLPNIDDEEAMLLRGRRSALHEARKQATEGLRDAYNATQAADWNSLDDWASQCIDYAARLSTLAQMWQAVEQTKN